MKLNPSQQNAKINSSDMVKFLIGEIGIILYSRVSQVKIHLTSQFPQYMLCMTEKPANQVEVYFEACLLWHELIDELCYLLMGLIVEVIKAF